MKLPSTKSSSDSSLSYTSANGACYFRAIWYRIINSTSEMSIYHSGTFRRSGGVASAIAKQLKGINLKAVQRITVTFDPFAKNVITAREVLHHLSSTKIVATNPKCLLKTDVVCDRRPAEIKFSLISEVQEQIKSKQIKFVCDNLTTLEVLQLCNKHISAFAPKEEIVSVPQTKSAKKAQGVGKGGKKK